MQKKNKRQYPPIFEKLIPIALVTILIIFIIVLMITLGVATGFLKGT